MGGEQRARSAGRESTNLIFSSFLTCLADEGCTKAKVTIDKHV